MAPASQAVRAFTGIYPASSPKRTPSMIDSGHGFPSRNRGRLSSANTPKTGVPKPTVPKIFVPAAATFLASSLLTQSLLGRCTSSGTPASTAADHSTRAHGVNLDPNARFLRLVQYSPENFQFFFAWSRNRGKSDLAGKLDSHL